MSPDRCSTLRGGTNVLSTSVLNRAPTEPFTQVLLQQQPSLEELDVERPARASHQVRGESNPFHKRRAREEASRKGERELGTKPSLSFFCFHSLDTQRIDPQTLTILVPLGCRTCCLQEQSLGISRLTYQHHSTFECAISMRHGDDEE